MKNIFSLQLIKMFNYYCDVVVDYDNCKIILILLSFVCENFEDFFHYASMMNNQDKLEEIINRIVSEVGGI